MALAAARDLLLRLRFQPNNIRPAKRTSTVNGSGMMLIFPSAATAASFEPAPAADATLANTHSRINANANHFHLSARLHISFFSFFYPLLPDGPDSIKTDGTRVTSLSRVPIVFDQPARLLCQHANRSVPADVRYMGFSLTPCFASFRQPTFSFSGRIPKNAGRLYSMPSSVRAKKKGVRHSLSHTHT